MENAQNEIVSIVETYGFVSFSLYPFISYRIFILTAYDTQKILAISVYDDGSEKFQKFAILGALELYLDFINIFLKMLRLFGKRK